MYTQVMKFGIRNILVGKEVVFRQKAQAHDYYKKLVVLHRGERLRRHRVMCKFFPELVAAEAELERCRSAINDIYTDIKAARKKASVTKKGIKPKKVRATAEQTAKLKQLRADKEEAIEAVHKFRKEFYELIFEAELEFESRTKNLPKALILKAREMSAKIKEAKKTKNNPQVPILLKQQEPILREMKKGRQTGALNKAREAVFAEMRQDPQWPLAWKLDKYIDLDIIRRTNDMGDYQLTHGTYATVRKNIVQSKTSKKKGLPDPNKVRWRGGRKIGRQVAITPDALTGEKLFAGSDKRLRVTDVTPLRGRRDVDKRVNPTKGSSREQKRYAVVHMLLDNNTPISCEVFLHRPIPKDATVTWAFIVPHQQVGRISFSLQLTIQTKRRLIERAVGKGDLVLRLGWSREHPLATEEIYRGIKVATSEKETVTLPGIIYEKIDYHEALKGICGEMFKNKYEAPRQGVSQQLAAAFLKTPELFPDWLRDKDHLKSSTALAKAVRRWMFELCEPADEEDRFRNMIRTEQGLVSRKELFRKWRRFREIPNRRNERGSRQLKDTFPQHRQILTDWLVQQGITEPHLHWALWLEWWRIKDRHIFQMAIDIDKKARRRRRDFYRNLAAELSMKYETIGVLELDIADAAKRKTPDKDEKELHKRARYQRGVACLSELKSCLQHAFGKERYREIKREQSANAA